MKMSDDVSFMDDADAFFDLALDLLCVAGTDGYFKKVNPAFVRTLGYSVDELLSTPFLDFVHPSDRDATSRQVQRLADGEDTVHFENRYRCKDGSWRWLAWCAPAPRDESGVLYAVGRDMTAKREIEEQISIRDSVFSSMDNGLVISDARQADNPVIYCNAAFYQLTGYSAEEAIGRNCRFLQGSDQSQPQLRVLRHAIEEGTTCRVLLRNYRKDGSLFWNELSISPVRNRQTEITHFVGLQRDVSDLVSVSDEQRADVERRVSTLPPRQREIMELIVEGMNTKSIAMQLGISPKTVETHRARMFRAMGVVDSVDLVRLILGGQTYES